MFISLQPVKIIKSMAGGLSKDKLNSIVNNNTKNDNNNVRILMCLITHQIM